jgi:alkanesulfonate monooxygenase SsuD/methylene tetrahydromethanopterin reductase-like flavin-dependent oxidoreductase (luciferase family)
MVKVILQLYPTLRAENEAEREQLRPLGRNNERFQEFIDTLPQVAQAADDLGLWGISTIEHHFHSEGYEVGPNPTALGIHLAGLTKRVRVGQLGYTMSAQNPFRVAEDVALLDHITKGRCFAGFSRGYQSRWTNVFGQHLGVAATMSPQGLDAKKLAELTGEQLRHEQQVDQVNRDVFEEQVDMVIDAWTKDCISYNTPRWKVPFPYDEGIEWGMGPVTARLGAPGEIGEDGRVHGVSVCPAPYTDPHPPVFVASTASTQTVEYCGQHGFNPTYFSNITKAAKFGRAYVERGAEVGRKYAYGQNQALVRWMQTGPTAEAATQALMDYDAEMYKNLYQPLTPAMPYDPADPVGSVLSCGLWSVGTVDEVRQDFARQWDELPAEYCVLIFHYPHMPAGKVIENLEAFMAKIKPDLDARVEAAGYSES